MQRLTPLEVRAMSGTAYDPGSDGATMTIP